MMKLAIVLLLVCCGFESCKGQELTPGSYQMSRYQEDWSTLRDSQSLNGYERLKYLPLGKNSYLSLGGELRWVYERFGNAYWQAAPVNGYLLQRYLLHSDWQLGHSTQVFAQLGAGFEEGRRGGPRPIDEDALYVHQAFIGHTFRLNDEFELRGRVGRQELPLGSARLFAFREGPNLRLGHDALRADLTTGASTHTAFYGRPHLNRPGLLDNPILDPAETFWGYYYSRSIGQTEKSLDLYYVAQTRQQASYRELEGQEQRHILGGRWHGQDGRWRFDHEVMWQFGSVGEQRIRAYTASFLNEVSWREANWQPSLGINLEIGSGDRRVGDGVLHTFRTFYQNASYCGYSAPIGPANLFDVHPKFHLRPTDRLNLRLEGIFFWRLRSTDALYNSNSDVVWQADNDRHYAGWMPLVEASYQLTDQLELFATYNYFFVGSHIQAGGGNDYTYFYTYCRIYW